MNPDFKGRYKYNIIRKKLWNHIELPQLHKSQTNLFFSQHRTVANSNHYPILCQLRRRLKIYHFSPSSTPRNNNNSYNPKKKKNTHTHTQCLCYCVNVRERERERPWERGGDRRVNGQRYHRGQQLSRNLAEKSRTLPTDPTLLVFTNSKSSLDISGRLSPKLFVVFFLVRNESTKPSTQQKAKQAQLLLFFFFSFFFFYVMGISAIKKGVFGVLLGAAVAVRYNEPGLFLGQRSTNENKDLT